MALDLIITESLGEKGVGEPQLMQQNTLKSESLGISRPQTSSTDTITYSELMKFSFVRLNFRNENTNHSKIESMTLSTLMYKEYSKQLAVLHRYHLICKDKRLRPLLHDVCTCVYAHKCTHFMLHYLSYLENLNLSFARHLSI